MDPRMKELARRLVGRCVKVRPGDNVLIEAQEAHAAPLVNLIIDEVYRAGGRPFPVFELASVTRRLLLGCSDEQIMLHYTPLAGLLERMDCSIGIRGFVNDSEMGDVPKAGMAAWQTAKAMLRERRMRLRWVLLRCPGDAIAQLAHMSTEAYEDFYYRVCNFDYEAMEKASLPLKELMERTDIVTLKGPGTDISFSIKGIPAVPCCGEINIPDGEVYTAPVAGTANGTISFNLPSVFQDTSFENIVLTLKDGVVVKASSNHTEKLNWILDTDEGARRIGEFAFGINPMIRVCTNDGSVDEKMWGSIHFTPGNFCAGADNGNISGIHWDMVLAQTPEHGGGEVYFDGVLVRKDGRFLPEELQGLNFGN